MYMMHISYKITPPEEITMSTMTIAHARAHLGEVIGRVRHGGDRVVLTNRGKAAVALIPLADLDALEAMEDAQDAAAARKALAAVDAGRTKPIPHAEVVAAYQRKRGTKRKTPR
jgi:prevent-host-death family protein